MKRSTLTILALAVAAIGGCFSGNAPYMTPERLDRGLVVILPGIEGVSRTNLRIRRAIDDGGVDRSLQIWPWGWPVPLVGMVMNQIDFVGNYLNAHVIARRIMTYQDEYPGRPVHIVGQSGGGGIAIMAAQALPEDRQIDGVILLSASMSSAYDIAKALKRSRSGIVNYYNPNDAILLAIATTVLGNVDGLHGPSAGLIGFDEPGESASDERKEAYRKLYQIRLTSLMVAGRNGSHFSTSRYDFLAQYVTPLLLDSNWQVLAHACGPADLVEPAPEPHRFRVTPGS